MATKAVVIYEGPIKRGRPSLYSDELAAEICERIASGETLTAICAEDDMPTVRTVTRWLMEDRGGFSSRYACAREAQAHVEAEQIRDIGDNLSILPEHKRIMVETRKWRAERLNRRVYGNSTRHEHEHSVHPAHDTRQLPPGLEWLEKRLPSGGDRSEPDPGAMGEG